MSETNTTPDITSKTKKKYIYARISVRGPHGKTTISISPNEYNALALLARGSATTSEARRISEACRVAARELLAAGHTGKFSKAVRQLAHAKLQGAYREEYAQAFDKMQYPEAQPIAA